MKATVTPILEFLEGSKQFVVPIYQRAYSWKKEHCERLWDDIVNIGGTPEPLSHFFGSIVYMEPELQNLSTVRQLLVIDGQQRLTTLSLLLSALCSFIEEQDIEIGITPKELSDNYLFNDKTGELRYKQILTRHDKNVMINILENRTSTEKSLLRDNYRFFLSQLKKIHLPIVYKGLQGLNIVDIMLARSEDNPQLIFETLNSAGLPLSQTDLIRNYILMGQPIDIQKHLYDSYWFPIENRFRDLEKRLFDRFIKDYLTLSTRRIPNISNVYKDFRRHVPRTETSQELEEILGTISRYANHYVNITTPNEEDSELYKCLKDLHALDFKVAYPFLLEAYDDYREQKIIGKSDLVKILRLTEGYIFRRSICEIPTNALNKVFASLMDKVDKNNYMESLNEVFLDMSGTQRYPRDSEFREKFVSKDVYNFNKRRYMLHRLENYGRKESVETDDYTIEHIMPQTLSDSWKQELGENHEQIHEIWLHRIGNITLTGYNPEYSNRSFDYKRTTEPEGFCYSPLFLNRYLAKVEEWNEVNIVVRGTDLAEKACKIWIYPDR